MNFKKLFVFAAAISTINVGAFTDVKHIDPRCSFTHTPGNLHINVHDIPNMKKDRFTLTITPDGQHIIIEGHSKKETDTTGEHTKIGEKYCIAFSKIIALSQTIDPNVIQSKKYEYKDRKKAALKGIIFEEYLFNELRIKIPTRS